MSARRALTGGRLPRSTLGPLRIAAPADLRQTAYAVSHRIDGHGAAMSRADFHRAVQGLRFNSDRHWGGISFAVNVSYAQRPAFEALLTALNGIPKFILNSSNSNLPAGVAPYYMPSLYVNIGTEAIVGWDTSRPGIDAMFAGLRNTVTRARDEGRVMMDAPTLSSVALSECRRAARSTVRCSLTNAHTHTHLCPPPPLPRGLCVRYAE